MKFRVTRHVKDIQLMYDFYVTLIGLEVVGSFEGHHNYDGLILGVPDCDWQIEFTVSHEKPKHISDEDDILVLYFDGVEQYQKVITRMSAFRCIEFAPVNPYWEDHGKLFKDPEGYRIVLIDPSTLKAT